MNNLQNTVDKQKWRQIFTFIWEGRTNKSVKLCVLQTMNLTISIKQMQFKLYFT